MKKYIAAVLTAAVVGGIGVFAAETKYNAHATLSNVNFPAKDTGYTVTAIIGESDKAASNVIIYGRTGSPVAIPSAQLTSITTVLVSNASSQLASNDTVIIQWADGTTQYNTCGGTTATNTILGTATSAALTVNDKIYEITTIGKVTGGATSFSVIGNDVFQTKTDSPLRVTVDSGTNAFLSVTAH